jgi:DNA replication and repair protein RecF
MPALAAEDRFRARLAEARAGDAEQGRSAFGTHRSDLRVRDLARGLPAEQSSTGEQKALLVAIVLANARLQAETRGAAPLLLLDEIAAHLDADRRRALFDEICALGAQAWMTGTEEDLFAPLDGRAQFFRVHDATLTTG